LDEKGVKMEGTVAVSIEKFEELLTAKLRCQMVEKTIQKALNEDDGYVSTSHLAIILGLEKEKNDESNNN
jgi:hypothetical protein